MERNKALLLRTDETFDRIGGVRVFSKIDLKTGFHQCRMKHHEIEKMDSNTRYGQFENLNLQVGETNAAKTF